MDTLKKIIKEMMRCTLRYGEQLHSLITEKIIERSRSRGRSRLKYISQIMKDAGVTFYRKLKNMVYDRTKGIGHLL